VRSEAPAALQFEANKATDTSRNNNNNKLNSISDKNSNKKGEEQEK
jgi:hypothetical protein